MHASAADINRVLQALLASTGSVPWQAAMLHDAPPKASGIAHVGISLSLSLPFPLSAHTYMLPNKLASPDQEGQ